MVEQACWLPNYEWTSDLRNFSLETVPAPDSIVGSLLVCVANHSSPEDSSIPQESLQLPSCPNTSSCDARQSLVVVSASEPRYRSRAPLYAIDPLLLGSKAPPLLDASEKARYSAVKDRRHGNFRSLSAQSYATLVDRSPKVQLHCSANKLACNSQQLVESYTRPYLVPPDVPSHQQSWFSSESNIHIRISENACI